MSKKTCKLVFSQIMFNFGKRPKSYSLIPSVHQHENIIKDNMGFLYFKSKRTQEKM